MNVPLAIEPPTPTPTPHDRGTEFEPWVPPSLVLVGGWQEDPKEKGTLTLEAWYNWVVISSRIRHQQEKHSSACSLHLLSDSKELIFPPRIVIYFQKSLRSSWSHQVVESLEDVMLQNPFDFSSQWTDSTGRSESQNRWSPDRWSGRISWNLAVAEDTKMLDIIGEALSVRICW